jgi:hypothetical protein
MDVKTGHVPENKDVALRPPSMHRTVVDGNTYELEVCEAFVYPSENDNYAGTAMDWATGYSYSKEQITVIQGLSNEWFTNLRLVGISHRGNGGIAYKVVTASGWMVDLREDVFIECLMAGEIDTRKGSVMSPKTPMGDGTYLTGKFVWAVLGSQTRLVRYKSKLYESLLESGKRKLLKKIPMKDLEAGGIYETKSGERSVMLGRVKGRGFLSYKLSKHGDPKSDYAKFVQMSSVENPILGWKLKFMKSSNFVMKIGEIEVQAGLVEKHVKRVESEYQAAQKELEAWKNRGFR